MRVKGWIRCHAAVSMSSLDDFFAKKDKRKKGKNKNFVTSESLVKTIEEHQAPQPPSEQQENKVKTDIPAVPTQEDEWKEEEEQIQDLEGLRVQKLDKDVDQESEKEQQRRTEEDENEGEGEIVSKDMPASSPWQNVTLQQQTDSTPQTEAEPEQELQPEKLPNVHGDVYIPPANRGGSGGGGGGGGRGGGAYVPPAARSAYVPPHLKRGGDGEGGGAYVPPNLRGGGAGKASKLPPDLRSAVAFPSLHSVAKKGEESSTERGTDFKEVHGSKSSRSSDANYLAPDLELTNKYSVLEDSD